LVRQLLVSMTMPQKATVLDHLVRLGRNEVNPLVIEILDSAQEPERTQLAAILIRSDAEGG
jgi:hypothetical protein